LFFVILDEYHDIFHRQFFFSDWFSFGLATTTTALRLVRHERAYDMERLTQQTQLLSYTQFKLQTVVVVGAVRESLSPCVCCK